MTIRCSASHLVTSLLSWRNPQGAEGWILPNQRIPDRWVHVKKVVATEIGLIVLVLLSIIETVAFTTFFLLSLIICPFSRGPIKRFAQLTGSSLFTMIWGIVNLCINPVLYNLATDERSARRLASGGCFIPGLYRQEDHEYVQGLLTTLQIFTQPAPHEPAHPGTNNVQANHWDEALAASSTSVY